MRMNAASRSIAVGLGEQYSATVKEESDLHSVGSLPPARPVRIRLLAQRRKGAKDAGLSKGRLGSIVRAF
jgi:hypothetical protein